MNDLKQNIYAIVEALEEKKGEEIQVLHVEPITTLAEYFVICTATSSTHVKALADNVDFRMKNDHNLPPHHTEGKGAGGWILLDFGFALVHVFLKEARDFYALEKLWQDAETVDLESLKN